MIREILIGLFMCVTLVVSMSTTHVPNHSTQEPLERENYIFKYEPHYHNMLVVTDIKQMTICYIFNITDTERASIHTDAGLRAVELRLLSTLKFVSFTEVTKQQLHAPTARRCGTVNHYYKQN